MAPQSSTLSVKGWQTAGWMLVTSLQYGWHISALNQIQAALTCLSPHKNPPSSLLPSCIPMSTFAFAVVTSSFTVGGLLGSIAAHNSMEYFGRKVSIRINSFLIFLGSTLMAVSASITPLIIGRLLIGAGSGLGLCVVPAYLSEISPPAIRGSIGVLNQLGIVMGIFLTQSLGIVLAAPSLWRLIPFIASAIALVQILLSYYAVDSPAWLSAKSRLLEAKAAATLLWGDQTLVPPARRTQDTVREEEALLSHDNVESATSYRPPTPTSIRPGTPTFIRPDTPTSFRPATPVHEPPTFHQLVRPPLLRPLLIVCFGMIAQQLSGINAVLYYSTDILSRVIPDAAAYVSLGVTVVNALMTFPPIYLIERVGRRSLITISTFGALLSLLGVGYGIDGNHIVLASIAIITFVASFAIGLGPVPFIIIADVSPFHAVSSLSSIALSLNWIANFFVGIGFIPLRDYLGGDDDHRQGRVFYVFAAVLLSIYFAWSKVYKG